MDNLGFGLAFQLKDEFSRTADTIQSNFQKLGLDADTMGRKVQNSIDRMKVGFASIGAGAILLTPLGAGLRESMALNKQLSDTVAKTGLQGKQAEMAQNALKQQSIDLGKKTAFTAKQVAESQGFLAMAGFKTNQILEAQAGLLNLAAASNTDLATAADIASDTLTAMGMKASDMNYLANQMAFVANSANTSVVQLGEMLKYSTATAKSLGVTSGELLAFGGMLGDIGLKGSVAGTTMENFLAHLGNIKAGKMTNALTELGLTRGDLIDAQGNLKSLTEIVPMLQQSLAGVRGNAQRMALGEELFGKIGGKALNAFIKGEGDTMKKGFNEFANSVINVSEDYAERTAQRQLDNLAGDITIMQSAFSGLLISIGDTIEPMARKITQAFTTTLSFVTEVMDSKVGKSIVFVAGTVGTLAVAFGGLVVATNLARFASLQAAQTFVSLGKTQIATAFATKGLAGGFKALALSAYKAMIPMLPYIAIGVAIGGAILFAYKSFQSFQDVLNGTQKPAQGLLGFMQRLGGVVWGVIQVFKSWDGKAFDLGGKETELKALGILGTVQSLATWVVRLMEFGKGLATGLSQSFAAIGSVFMVAYNQIVGGINDLANRFGMQSLIIGKATSSVQDWATVGKYVGYTILPILTLAFGSFAVSVIAATWPIIAVGTAIVGVIAIFRNWGAITTWFGNLATNVWNSLQTAIGIAVNGITTLVSGLITGIVNGFLGMLNWIFVTVPNSMYQSFMSAVTGVQESLLGLPSFITEQFFSMGNNMVTSLQEGVSSMWNDFIQWIYNKISAIPGLASILETITGESIDLNAPIANASANTVQPSRIGRETAQVVRNQSARGQGFRDFSQPQTKTDQPPINLNITLDGEKVHKSVARTDNKKSARK